MKRIALVHTVKSVMETFGDQLRMVLGEEIGPVKISDTLDTFLLDDTSGTGSFSCNNRARFFFILQACQMTGADVIAVTCSSLSSAVVDLRPFLTTPVIAIDDILCEKAVQLADSRIDLLATAPSAIEPVKSKLTAFADKAGRKLEIFPTVCTEAMSALQAGDRDEHDRLVIETVQNLENPELIVLAQASMAHLEQSLTALRNRRVLSSPALCMMQIKEFIKGDVALKSL